MKFASVTIAVALASSLAWAENKLAAKPGTPPSATPAPKPQPSPKDLALAEARKFDLNHNGKIEGAEATEFEKAYVAEQQAGKGYLYLFDEDRDKQFSDTEIAKINLGTPKPKSARPQPSPPQPPKPAPKPGSPPPAPPAPKPQPSVKDLALATARKFDLNHNGRIDDNEVFELQNAYINEVKAGKGFLYLFDDDGDKHLSEMEIQKIDIGAPKPPPPAAKPPAKPAPKKK